MMKNISQTPTFKSLSLEKQSSQAYLFYSSDSKFNNEIALNFAKSLVCSSHSNCDICPNCKQFNSFSHSDVTIIDQDSIKVEDVEKIIDKLSTKPLSCQYRIFVILNIENINERAQNKLLKSIEEPNDSTIFVFTTSKTDKILPTILSRLTKILVPKLSFEDKLILKNELSTLSIDVSKYMSTYVSLTEIFNLELDQTYKDTMSIIQNIFSNLSSTQDIPKVANKLKPANKTLFFQILQDIFLSVLYGNKKYPEDIMTTFSTYSKTAIIKIIPLIDEASKKSVSNVNFSYILDTLLFNILKEKYLCK